MIIKRINSFMASNINAYWRGIEMLPVIHEYIEAELADAVVQLNQLAAMQQESYSIDTLVAEGIFNRYSDKIAQRYEIEKQCHIWRSIKYLSQNHVNTIVILENNLTKLNKLSQQILFFVEHFQRTGMARQRYARCA